MTAASTRNQLARAALAQVVIFDRTVPQEPAAVAKSYAIADAVILALGASTFTRNNMAAAAVLALTDFLRNGNVPDDAAIASAAVSIADLMVASSTGPDVPPGGGGTIVGTDPNALVYLDPTGTSGVTDPKLTAAPIDAFGRPQLWDDRAAAGTGAVFRQGSWQADGDPTSQTAEGAVYYGPNALGNGPDPAEGGYARVKPRRFGLAQIIPGVNGGNLFYYFRVDSDSINGLRLTDDLDVESFGIDRLTGEIRQRLTTQLVTMGPSELVYRPGAVAPFPPGVVGSWPELMAAFAGTAGPVTIAIDTSIGPTVLPPGVYDFQGRARFVPYQSLCTAGAGISLDITDGAQILNPSEFSGAGRPRPVGGAPLFFVVCNGSVVNSVGFTMTGGNGARLKLSDGVQFENGAGILPNIQMVNGDQLHISMEGARTHIGALCIDGPAGADLILDGYSGAIVDDGAVTGNLTCQFRYDSSVRNPDMTPTAWTTFPQAAGITHGRTTLVAGKSPIIPSLGLSASSAIVPSFANPIPGLGNLTRSIAAFDVDRVFTANAGSFRITACLADGTINVADVSDVDYVVIG